MSAIFPGNESYTYRPGNVPPQQNWFERTSYERGEEIDSKAKAASDFFVQSDNTEADLDARAGYVRLKDAPAPGLLERVTTTVTGYRTADGDLQVTGQNEGYPATTLALSENGTEAYMDRPWYLNDRYMATLESLTYNADGTRTISGAYYNHLG